MATEESCPLAVLMHDDDVVISEGTARVLVDEQFPDYAGLALRRVPSWGTVNVIFRLGDGLAARFPRRASAPDTSRTALQWEAERAEEFAERSPVPAPQPVGIGDPGRGYPMSWSIQTWVSGSLATPTGAAESTELAHDLAELVAALRDTPTRGRRFAGGNRGGDLGVHDGWVETCLARSEGLLDVEALRVLWGRLRGTPRDQTDAMCHGDLIPGNLLIADGRLTGVIDTGGFGPADPALDLIAAWHVLGDDAREVFRADLGCEDDEWARGKAWAFEQAIGAAWYYEQTNQPMHEMGMVTLRRLLAT